eukprot:6186760-Pleurochrysis_carterae.AAC.1
MMGQLARSRPTQSARSKQHAHGLVHTDRTRHRQTSQTQPARHCPDPPPFPIACYWSLSSSHNPRDLR